MISPVLYVLLLGSSYILCVNTQPYPRPRSPFRRSPFIGRLQAQARPKYREEETTENIIQINYAEEQNIEEEYVEPEYCNIECPVDPDCVLGRLIDENGCKTCDCKLEGAFEGDILVTTEEEYRGIEMKYSSFNSRASDTNQNVWPKWTDVVEIPYILYGVEDIHLQNRIKAAVKRYDSKTCIRFKEISNTTENKPHDHLLLIGTQPFTCASHIGRNGGEQHLYVGEKCSYGSIIHELMHALGFWHEHSRGDRDDHITVLWENVREGSERNFKKQGPSWTSYKVPYNINSVMHYGGTYFSKNGEATIVKKGTMQRVLAQRSDFEETDLRQINEKYGCTDYIPKEMEEIEEMEEMEKTKEMEKIEEMEEIEEIEEIVQPCEDTSSPAFCQWIVNNDVCPFEEHRTGCLKSCGACEEVAVTQPTTTTTTTTTVPVTTTTRATCADKHPHCSVWESIGYCIHESYRNSMEHWCPKSCWYCT